MNQLTLAFKEKVCVGFEDPSKTDRTELGERRTEWCKNGDKFFPLINFVWTRMSLELSPNLTDEIQKPTHPCLV